MNTPQLLFELSPWFILLCIIAGGGYAYLLYNTTNPWGKTTNALLAALRFAAVFLICFLLLGPFLKQILNSTENPTFVYVLDDSSSVTQTSDSTSHSSLLAQLQSLVTSMEALGFESDIKTISAERLAQVTDLRNDSKSTDLNHVLKTIQSDYEGRNLGGVLLVTDGIYNQGLSPTFSTYNFNIHTLGLGDSIAREDIQIRNIYYNKIAYQGNRFPIVVEVINSGFVGQRATVRILKEGEQVASQDVNFESDNQLARLDFNIEAEENGIQHYRVELSPLEGESVYSNNYKDAYIDVIEGRERILLVGLAPHPDIKAIASTIENNENYELKIHIPGIEDFEEDKYDLVIFHQAFDRFNRNNRLLQRFMESNTPLWLIAGNQSNINSFNQLNGLMKITVANNQRDLVRPAHNRGFSRFKMNSEDYQSTLTEYPPVTVPFGKTELTDGGEVLLYQQVGSIVTNKPLLAIHENTDRKIAVMIGEGFWQWRTAEFARNDGHETFDEMVSKLIQFLSAKEDKRKFRVYPSENQFYDTDDVLFETEVYNDIYEPVYGNEIQLDISGENGFQSSYSYTTSSASNQYRIRGLDQGVYRYNASTLLNGNAVSSSGEFSVRELQIESLNLTANYSVLRKLSKDSGGQFYHADQVDQLITYLGGLSPQGIIYSSETFLPLINLKWIFFLLMALLSTEWFIRKYSGAY